ncbi:MAG: cyclic nucleotide-binding domain-containing protein [Gemmataceae bacterium]|nr:cyclic nucleotide-binding domain-containing protein [Gemmataceae bacterium]MDW8266925.1 cyclic nucleotide-binding domain-containing protein [Gemmataceae bacterium]
MSNPPGILGAFAQHEFLRGLSERNLMILASGARPLHANPGEYLAREGESARAFYLINAGQVSLGMHTPDGRVVIVQTVGPGEVIGWSWLVPPHRWQFDCRAEDEVQGVMFDAEWLREKCEQDHSLGYQFLKQMIIKIASRLEATREQLLKSRF